MKKKYIIIHLLLLLGLTSQAEEWHSLSIVELAIQSDRIVEAKYLTTVDNQSRFLISNMDNGNGNVDTLVLLGLDRLFHNLIELEKADSIILYLDNKISSRISWSGIRMLIGGDTYLPLQYSNPDKFTLVKANDGIKWTELKNNIVETQRRIKKVKELRDIGDSKSLLNWIKEQYFDLNCEGGLNENKGWGSFSYEVFNWITENNIASDTWKASMLFRRIHCPNGSKCLGSQGLLNDLNGSSFQTYEEIDFLISRSLDDSSSVIEKKQSLNYLKLACIKVYENNYPIPQKNILNLQKIKQKSIRNQILPLLKDPNLQVLAFRIISKLSNPLDGNLENRIDLEALPLLISYYQSESPSFFKSELAKFIARNSTKEGWKKVSKCDENIFVDLYHVTLDTLNSEVKFGINYSNSKLPIAELPTVIVEDVFLDSIVLTKVCEDFKLPYYDGQGVRFISFGIGGLKSSDFRVSVQGKAGDKSEFSWQSEYGQFKIERKNLITIDKKE